MPVTMAMYHLIFWVPADDEIRFLPTHIMGCLIPGITSYISF